jgi:hypothetical protein
MPRQQLSRTPASLEEAKRRFDAWRRSHRWLGRVPNQLWKMAAETAAAHGVDATARHLLLSPARLQQWLTRIEPPAAPVEETPQFLELSPIAFGGAAECTLELEDNSGKKLRIVLKGQATHQAAVLGQLLWKGDA